ncbi:CYTH domain-containing protein [Planomicrobium sp. CPCC 101079]|uniref:CYTH domain-containing protein n=1 Tax=Planomicrobium sp. CPCC 101079 TaxID=2599618 RepID=UPI0011B7EF7D|nr:CYTH domain-containing protein [Planomicrobium sp. CPCC 101079]TWT04841.1 CYTH domain-containing protein [Planomicrobium sp. CPCC 101079]
MTKELEIEFKNMLTQEKYEELLSFFKFQPSNAVTQENQYFDTRDFQLKEKRCALRIRKKSDRYECTLKIPAQEGNFEITDLLTAQEAQNIQHAVSFDAIEVLQALTEQGIDWKALRPIGTLVTHRIEFEYNGGLLVLDHSLYNGQEDFEVEYEVTDAAAGQQKFNRFLTEHDIPVHPADKKIARFMKAAKSQF